MEWNNNIKKECKNYTNCSHYRRTPQSVSLQNNKSNNKDYHFQNRPCTKISESIYKTHIEQYCQNQSRQYKCQYAFPLAYQQTKANNEETSVKPNQIIA